jgi:hypothetical protein
MLDSHPELDKQVRRIRKTLAQPEHVVRSSTDADVQLYYRYYRSSPVGPKYLCVVVKSLENDYFMLTAYFTDTIKRGKILWTKAKK